MASKPERLVRAWSLDGRQSSLFLIPDEVTRRIEHQKGQHSLVQRGGGHPVMIPENQGASSAPAGPGTVATGQRSATRGKYSSSSAPAGPGKVATGVAQRN